MHDMRAHRAIKRCMNAQHVLNRLVVEPEDKGLDESLFESCDSVTTL